VARYCAEGLAGLRDRSSRPRRLRCPTPQEVESDPLQAAYQQHVVRRRLVAAVPAPFGQAPANAPPLQQQLRRQGRRNVQRVMRISKRSFGRDLEGVAGCPPALLYKLPKTRASAAVSLNSNRSLPTFEPVSVRGREVRREKVRRGQRLGRHFCRRWPIPSGRDRTIPRLPRQSRGKSKTIPTARGNDYAGRWMSGRDE
jgi:hypothetical protein